MAGAARDRRTLTLGAIAIVAAFAAATQGVYGNVDVPDALLVGIPAVGGVLLGTWLGQRVPAEATSLLAIVPVALVGSWRQRAYGNLVLGDAAVMGVLSIAGVLAGVALANALPERALRIGFALLLLNMARQLLERGLAGRRRRLAG